ncbi:MAG: hypothetical protein U0359_13635 [Byssovorax sp.]
MTKEKFLEILPDGKIAGLTVAGFHGRMAADETPARLAAVFLDASGSPTSIVEVGPTTWTPAGKARIESFPPAIAEGESLPGEGTRTRRWSARSGNLFMALGPDERGRVGELRGYAQRHGTARVRRFVDWFGGSTPVDDTLQAERQGEIALWYCSEDDAFSLLDCVHRVVKDVFFRAWKGQSPEEIEDVAWWLSRAAVSDHDIYLSAAALRRVDSPAWELLLREGLHLPEKAQWSEGLAAAEWQLEHPPLIAEAEEEMPPSQTRYKSQAQVRKLFSATPANQVEPWVPSRLTSTG